MNTEYENYKSRVVGAYTDCEDFVCREGGNAGCRYALIYIRGITSRDFIAERILRPLLKADMNNFNGDFRSLLESLVLSAPKDPSDAVNSVAKGDVLIIVECGGNCFFALANAQQTQGRSIQEPSSDVTVRGPKAGFVEDAETNMALLRRYIRTPSIKFRRFTVGSVSETKVIMAYVGGRADAKRVEDIAARISGISASVITDSANIAMLLDGNKSSLLPTCGSTEKVDKAASKLMSGRIAVIVDGSPFVLTLPYVFAESIQAADDYLHTPYYATFIRFIRLVAFAAAIFAPGILCASVTYHYSSIPTELYGIISESRKDIPLSFFWETVAILLLFELLREVGVRMPRTVGEAVGLVGSIILGNTAVEAGIVSSVGVITVAFSAVCAFITPAFMYVIVIARILTLVLGEAFGIYGLGISTTALIFLLCGKNSFGAPYMSPLAPYDRMGMQDFVFSLPKRTLGRIEKLGGD